MEALSALQEQGDNRRGAGTAGDVAGSKRLHIMLVGPNIAPEDNPYSVVSRRFRLDAGRSAGHECRTSCHLRAQNKNGISRFESAELASPSASICRGRLARGNCGTDLPLEGCGLATSHS